MEVSLVSRPTKAPPIRSGPKLGSAERPCASGYISRYQDKEEVKQELKAGTLIARASSTPWKKPEAELVPGQEEQEMEKAGALTETKRSCTYEQKELAWYKIALCKFFAGDGCQRGELCTYAHSEGEIGQRVVDYIKEGKKVVMCAFGAKCMRRDLSPENLRKCKFAHSKEEQLESATGPLPLPKKKPENRRRGEAAQHSRGRQRPRQKQEGGEAQWRGASRSPSRRQRQTRCRARLRSRAPSRWKRQASRSPPPKKETRRPPRQAEESRRQRRSPQKKEKRSKPSSKPERRSLSSVWSSEEEEIRERVWVGGSGWEDAPPVRKKV